MAEDLISSPSTSTLESGLEEAASLAGSYSHGGVFGSNTKSLEDSVMKAESEEVEGRLARLGLDDVTEEISASSDEFEDAREQLSPGKVGPEVAKGAEKWDVMSDEWKFQKKHIFILSDAGKPIYARHGDEDELSTLTALIRAHVAFVEDMDDHIRAIHCQDEASVVFLNKGPLILVVVSRGMETVTQLVVQLTYMYHQILSVLTLTQLTKIFEKRKNYDLRIMIRGCERLLDSLAKAMDTDPSFMLSAVRVLPLTTSCREGISTCISHHCRNIKNLVFVILIIDNRLVALVRKKEYFIHPADLHLIFNLVNSTESFRQAESWTPVCLPKFNSGGFLHAHVSYVSEECDACLMMLTVERDIFFQLSEAKHKIVASLERQGAVKAINESVTTCKYVPEDIGCPYIKHFLYKSKTTAQFTGSQLTAPYLDKESQLRLHNLYLYVQSKVHSSNRYIKIIYYSGRLENVMGWATQAFELYATFDPMTSKSKAISAMNKLQKWAKKEENTIFILSAPTFN